MIAVVNPSAAGGRARERWARVLPALRELHPGVRIAMLDHTGGARAAIRQALATGETEYVAAGGDGTVNLVAATLAELAPEALDRLALGALGLGSSNDFHKPHQTGCELAGIPSRLRFSQAQPRDVCGLRCTQLGGVERTRVFLVNASIGVTADANWLFNHPGPWLSLLKRLSTGTAIGWAALRTVLHVRPLEVMLGLDGAPAERVVLHNLGVVKSPGFAGGLRYDSAFEPASGKLAVHLLRAMTRARLLQVLAGLARGRFGGQEGTASWQARRVSLRAERPFAVEADGEVIRAIAADFFVMPRRLRVCPR